MNTSTKLKISVIAAMILLQACQRAEKLTDYRDQQTELEIKMKELEYMRALSEFKSVLETRLLMDTVERLITETEKRLAQKK
jgi:regulator of sigma D